MTTQEMKMWIHLFKKFQKQTIMKNEHKKQIMVTQLVNSKFANYKSQIHQS
jgi:hypothetical protein